MRQAIGIVVVAGLSFALTSAAARAWRTAQAPVSATPSEAVFAGACRPVRVVYADGLGRTEAVCRPGP